LNLNEFKADFMLKKDVLPFKTPFMKLSILPALSFFIASVTCI
jgi:hypothetical protein